MRAHEGRALHALQREQLRALLAQRALAQRAAAARAIDVVLVRRELGADVAEAVEDGIRRSLLFARKNPEKVWPYIKMHAQEMDDSVIRQHIDLYVNDYSLELGEEGTLAIRRLLELAHQRGLVPPLPASLFFGK